MAGLVIDGILLQLGTETAVSDPQRVVRQPREEMVQRVIAKAHRRLCAELESGSAYHASSHRGLSPLVRRLAASTLTNRRNSA